MSSKNVRGTNSNGAETHDSCVNVLVAVFGKFVELKLKPKQVRAFAKACLLVGQKARDSWHVMQLITVLLDEADEEGVPNSKLGTHLLERVQSKPLPKVKRSFNPFVLEESLK